MRKYNEEMENMEKSWQDKLAEREQEYQAALAAEKTKSEQMKTVPHLWNLNEDPALCGMVVHFCPKGKTTIGNSKNDPPPGIGMSGLGWV